MAVKESAKEGVYATSISRSEDKPVEAKEESEVTYVGKAVHPFRDTIKAEDT